MAQMYKEDLTQLGNKRHRPVMAHFKDLSDMRHYVSKTTHGVKPGDKWAGGSIADFYDGCEKGDIKYASRAEPLVERFSNLAIEDYDRTIEYNEQNGVLDYQAAMGGDPLCMYGQTIDIVDTSPVHITVDAWISSTVPAYEIERRGVAIMALARAVSIYRAVTVTIVAGAYHSNADRNVLVAVPVPTNPMDLSRAAWMLASPVFVRHGVHSVQYQLSGKKGGDGLFRLKGLERWQEDEMGKWWTEKQGGGHTVFLPLMMGRGGDKRWSSDETAAKWVSETLAEILTNQPCND